MALDTELVRLLLEARSTGISFRRCVTLGRQNYFPSDSETRRLLRRFGIDCNRYPKLFGAARPKFSEPFWEVLGVEHLESIDISDFHGASLIHDLNLPIPEALSERFDVVCDAGTLEHIFCFPVALQSCMRMVCEGGHLFLFTTANNHFGHGFYQFSPELFYRALSPENGFRIQRMLAIEYAPIPRRFEVADPQAIQCRGALINCYPVLLFLQAVRFETKPVLITPPQQSDYVSMWESFAARSLVGKSASGLDGWKYSLLEKAPRLARYLEAFRYSRWARGLSFRNSTAFRRLRD